MLHNNKERFSVKQGGDWPMVQQALLALPAWNLDRKVAKKRGEKSKSSQVGLELHSG